MSTSNYLEDAVANALRGGGNGTSYTAPAAVYMKLHTGDPGEDCTANAASVTTRKEVQFGAASNGVLTLSNAPSWAAPYGAAESLTHFSIWDHVSAGNALGSGALDSTHVMQAADQLDITALTWTWT